MLVLQRSFRIDGHDVPLDTSAQMQEHADGITLSDNANSAVLSDVHPAVGVAVDKNGKWRRTMEDAHMFIHDFDQVPGQGYFAIFDGHAGKFAAEWCRDNMSDILAKELQEHPTMDVREVMKNAFLKTDDQLEIESKNAGARSGCTAVLSLIRLEPGKDDRKKRVLYTANVGDARSVLCRGGKAIRLTYDHKGTDQFETKRITEKGGFLLNNRVNGKLSALLTGRCFGCDAFAW